MVSSFLPPLIMNDAIAVPHAPSTCAFSTRLTCEAKKK